MAKTAGVLGWVISLAAFGLVAGIVILPTLGWTPLVVVGSSMTPTLPNGALIVVRPADPARIRPGDVITYSQQGRLLTHRVVSLAAGPGFVTRGDGNRQNDGRMVTAAQVVGKLALFVPYLGLGYTYLGAGMNAVLLLPLVILIVLQVRRLLAEELLRALRPVPKAG